MTVRRIARPRRAPPIHAATYPVMASATSTDTKVSGTRTSAGASRIVSSGNTAPIVNATAEASAAAHGLATSSASMFSSTDRWALRASDAVSSVATRVAVSRESPCASYRPISSANSVSGSSASSRFSFWMSACSLSRWLDTETYSPSAIEMAPPTRAARPAMSTGPVSLVAPATPTTTAAVETMPSLAPRTPARSQFRRCESPWRCGSSGCAPGVAAGRFSLMD